MYICRFLYGDSAMYLNTYKHTYTYMYLICFYIFHYQYMTVWVAIKINTFLHNKNNWQRGVALLRCKNRFCHCIGSADKRLNEVLKMIIIAIKINTFNFKWMHTYIYIHMYIFVFLISELSIHKYFYSTHFQISILTKFVLRIFLKFIFFRKLYKICIHLVWKYFFIFNTKFVIV